MLKKLNFSLLMIVNLELLKINLEQQGIYFNNNNNNNNNNNKIRVVAWNEFKISNSFTLETSFFGYD